MIIVLFSFFLPLTVKLTFASTDPTLFVARAIYG
jgi:hypothetical protein